MDTSEADTRNSTTVAEDKRGLLVALALLVAVLAGAVVAYGLLVNGADSTSQTGSQPMQASDENLPHLEDFDARMLSTQGDMTTLTKVADGKPLVINFWATWCPYCIQEMDDFQAIYDDYGDWVSFAFVDATDGVRETIEGSRAWIEEHEYTLPFYYDTHYDVTANFGIQSFPTTVVVAANGDILTIASGRIDPELLRSALDSLR